MKTWSRLDNGPVWADIEKSGEPIYIAEVDGDIQGVSIISAVGVCTSRWTPLPVLLSSLCVEERNENYIKELELFSYFIYRTYTVCVLYCIIHIERISMIMNIL